MEHSYCGICYGTKGVQRLHCQHEFCSDCICKWKVEKMSCPVCRCLIAPNLNYSTRQNFYGDSVDVVFRFWHEMRESDRMIQFLVQLAYAKHSILCKDLQYKKKHLLLKKVIEYANCLFDSINRRYKLEKVQYDKTLRLLLILYPPQKRMETYKKKMVKLFEAVSRNEIEKYQENVIRYYRKYIQHNKTLCQVREEYVESKLKNYHQEDVKTLREELLEDEVFLEEQYFSTIFKKESDVSGVFLNDDNVVSESYFPLQTSLVIDEMVNEDPPHTEPLPSTDVVDISPSIHNECTASLERMLLKFEKYMVEPSMEIENYVKGGMFQKDFLWVMKNVFLYSFFHIDSNFPLSCYIYSYAETINNLLCYLGLKNSIYEETLEQFMELHEFLEKPTNVFKNFTTVMEHIVDENI